MAERIVTKSIRMPAELWEALQHQASEDTWRSAGAQARYLLRLGMEERRTGGSLAQNSDRSTSTAKHT